MRRADLIGKRFGRLTVVKDTNRKWKGGTRLWKCLCDCGKEVYTSTSHLKNGHTKSCGCLGIENCTAITITHGMCGTVEHNTYRSIKARCYNYKKYGIL